MCAREHTTGRHDEAILAHRWRLSGLTLLHHPQSEVRFLLWKYEGEGSGSILQMIKLRLREIVGK